ncbi:hypothetical protein JTE90_000944 [Oedothorax gibbosus]|uniref:Uncharacterized protein n=1 Tax=Oedothorax gibbosus TaxID=931172 RepID=A0AAV6U6T6_9ARAC|nr:hypothetical protein JTE90_000944 [Oedothorax gibbosus]
MAVTESSVYFIHSPSIPMTLKDPYNSSNPRVLESSSGHEAILEMHANSEASALFYVVVVLALYVLALVAVLAKYLRNERYDNRLTRLYDEFLSRDRFTNRAGKSEGGVSASQQQQIPLTRKEKKTESKVGEQKQALVAIPEFVV